MKLYERLFGSKYNEDIPYTYHAKYQVIEGSDELTKDWFGDTFCSVCNHLRDNDVQPASVTIYECYAGNDVEMPQDSYTDDNGGWLLQDSLCHAHIRYGSEGSYKDCKFGDRDKCKVI
ncbi:MAG TPA: hypothetical protein ENH48_06935 [Halieaceae bacterium]|nr:MAG: hypothetical protein DRQ98_03415 [Gammaproteobacteria bacterium]HDY82675.1 hypothetical protein [Halieaceae bacterium]